MYTINIPYLSAQQQNVNKEWQVKTGTPSELLDFSNSTFDSQNNVYLTGNHVLPNSTIAVLLEKFSSDGNLVWSEYWVCQSCSFASGVDLVVVNDTVYLAGVVQHASGNTGMDILVQKYKADTGQMLWSRVIDNNQSLVEFPVDILVNTMGTIFVTGATQQLGTGYDVFTTSLSSSGTIQWESLYDYASFDETPTELQSVNNNGVEVLVASAINATEWEVALLTYDHSGLLITTERSDLTGLDKSLPLTYHRSGNDLYVGGSQLDSINGNQNAYLKKYVIDTTIAEVWTKEVDINGRSETLLGIDLNTNGDIFVTGGTADAQDDNWAWIQHFNAQDGATIWQRIRSVAPAEDIVSGRYFQVNDQGQLLLAFNYTNSLGQSVHVAQYDENGRRRWEIPLVSSISTAKAANLMVGHQKAVFVVGRLEKNNGQQLYYIDKLESYEKLSTPIYDNDSIPYMIKEDLILRFNSCLLDTTFINDAYRLFDRVDNIVKDTALIAEMDAALEAGGKLGSWRLFKIYHSFNTHTTSFVGRHGRSVTIPPLWATLLLEMQDGTYTNDPYMAQAALDTIAGEKLLFTHPNFIGLATNPITSTILPPPPPDDPLFDEQRSLTDPILGINIQPAWDIMDAGDGSNWESSEFADGLDIVLLDSGVRFDHEDLRCANCPGIQPNMEGDPSIVMDVLDFSEGNTIPIDRRNDSFEGQVQDGNPSEHGHGTLTAGVLSAMRDNDTGVAGITGNDLNSVRLHSYRYVPTDPDAGADENTAVTFIIAALEFMLSCEIAAPGYPCSSRPELDLSCMEIQLRTGPELNVLNEESIAALREIIKLVYDGGFIQTAAKGNYGGSAAANAQRPIYPGAYDDRWILSVGASGTDGTVVIQGFNDGIDAYGSNYGQGMDLIAPGVQRDGNDNSVTTTTSKQTPTTYTTYGGTSSALPHVAGTAAMLMLHHPTPLAQEDIEHLLEYNATDIFGPFGLFIYPISYEDENGWGRLNTGESIKFIDPNEDDFQVVQVEVTGDLDKDEDPFGCGDMCNILLSYPEGDVSTDAAIIAGRIVKYSYDFAIDLEQYQISPPPMMINNDPGKLPFWVRSSGTNLWFTPVVGSNNTFEFVPANHLFFEGEPMFVDNIFVGTVAGYSVVMNEYEGSEPGTPAFKCPTGVNMTVSPSNTTSINECYSGPPRLSFSFLGQNPAAPVSPIKIDVITEVDQITVDVPVLKVFPNPTQNTCRVELLASERQEGIIVLLDGLGRVVFQKEIRLQAGLPISFYLDLEAYAQGIYHLRYTAAQQEAIIKIIKQ